MANLTFTSTGSTTVKLIAVGRPQQNIFTANNSSYTLGTVMSLGDGDTVQFSGQGNNLSLNESNYYKFETTGTGTLAISGDLKSLIGNSDYVKNHQFVKLFEGCSNIADISQLVFPTTVADFCYSNMFLNCTGLVNASTTLPATTLARWCYNTMFAGCTSLTSAPLIGATKVAPFCFFSMFYGCSSLTDAPAILTKNMSGDFTCNGMFRNCTSLSSVTVSIDNWSTAQNENKNWLYNVASVGTFTKPTTLASIPSAARPPDGWTVVDTYPNTIIAENQTFEFDAMNENQVTSAVVVTYTGSEETVTFNFDSSLLPSGVTFIGSSFVANGLDMNYNTPTYTSVIPMTLSTTAVDAAPVTITATINLVDIPTATISIIPIPAISWDFEEATTSSINLLQYVTYTTSDVTSANLSTAIIGELPEGVTYQNGVLSASKEYMDSNVNLQLTLSAYASDARAKTSNFDLNIEGAAIDYSTLPLTFKSYGTNTIKFGDNGVSGPKSDWRYKTIFNGVESNWQEWTYALWQNGYSLRDGEMISFSGTSRLTAQNSNIHFSFTSQGDGTYDIYGNLASIVNWSSGTVNQYEFKNTFLGFPIVNAQNLIIPFDSVNDCAFLQCFKGCTNLQKAPKQLPAIYLSNECYEAMFSGCTSLTTPPSLPATDLASYCYYQMFQGCTALTDAPQIQGINLVGNCCSYMFADCNNLSAITVHFTNFSNYTYNWVRNVRNDGTFTCPTALGTQSTITRTNSACPSNWTVVNI